MLLRVTTIVFFILLLVVILVFAKPFLMPLTFAALLAMLMLPFNRALEGKINKGLATIISVLVLLVFVGGLIALISWQASDMAKDTSKVVKEISTRYEQLQQYISEKIGISVDEQKEMMKGQQGPSKVMEIVSGVIAGIGGLATNIILIAVYIFLMLYFRGQIKTFILRIVPTDHKRAATDVLRKSQKVTQKYLSGYAIMIVILWVMYGIGFSIVGVKKAILFAIICGVLEIVPYVGNLTGTAVTILVSVIDGADRGVVIGILITYGLVQFIQTYLLEPLVLGREVNINPLVTVVGLVAGEMLWGVGGMVVAIPVMGIMKIAFDHVDGLHSVGEFMGSQKKKTRSIGSMLKSLQSRIKRTSKTSHV